MSINQLFESISIKNFKSWKNETEFPLDDINLLFGPNSAGKSSILQALMLLNQSSKTYTGFLSHETADQFPISQLNLVNAIRDYGTYEDITYKKKGNEIKFCLV